MKPTSIEFDNCILIKELDLIRIEIYLKDFLIKLYKIDELGVQAHLYGFLDIIIPKVSDHRKLDLLSIVSLISISHQLLIISDNQYTHRIFHP